MNNIEDLPRDAYDSPAQTVRPESVRRHDEQSAVISPPGRRRRPGRSLRVMGPLAAEAVVAAVILGTVVVPQALLGDRSARPSGPARHGQPPTSAATSPASRFAVTIFGETGTPLAVHSVRTGAVVARIRPPRPGMSFAAVATGDGRIYVVVLARPGVCRSWLYRFRLNGGGRPGALTPYALPSVGQLLGPIAVSKDDQTFAYRGERCAGPTGATESDLAAVNVATLRTRAWAISKRADVSSLSLTGNGGVLAYNIDLTRHFPSAGLVLPTNAAPGAAAQGSRVVVAAAQFGASAEISSDGITPDGSALYFSTNRTGSAAGPAWQLRVADVAAGQSRVVRRYAGAPYSLSANPSVPQALVVVQPVVVQPGEDSAPAATPTSTTQGSPAATPTPTPTPVPAPELLRIDLATGKATLLSQVGWESATLARYIW